MKKAIALSMMLLVPAGCGLSLQPTATSPTSASTDTSIPEGLEWTVYSTANSGLPSDTIYGLAIDAQVNIWIGTEGAGLARFDGQAWSVYSTDNSGLPHNTIYAIAIDARGTAWVGTYGGGLAKYDGETWTIYDTDNSGLPSNTIQHLAVDAQGSIWVGTHDAVSYTHLRAHET